MPFLARILRYRVVVCSLRTFRFAFLLAILIGLAAIGGQATSAADAAPAPNSDPTYQALRNLGLSAEAVSVNNLDLKRDAGTFHLRSGTVCFVAPVNAKVTGAVFTGDGVFVLEPPIASERW